MGAADTEYTAYITDHVSKNGILVLIVRSMADGTIPELQVQRLERLGARLSVDGSPGAGTERDVAVARCVLFR